MFISQLSFTSVSRTLLVDDYRSVLQENLKAGFPTGRYIKPFLGMSFFCGHSPCYHFSIDLSGMLQGKLQLPASEAAAAKTAYLVTWLISLVQISSTVHYGQSGSTLSRTHRNFIT